MTSTSVINAMSKENRELFVDAFVSTLIAIMIPVHSFIKSSRPSFRFLFS